MRGLTARGTVRRPRATVPWHLWVVAVLVLGLHVGGIWDYVSLLGPDRAYVEAQGWGEAGVQYFTDYPVTLRLLWTVVLLAGTAAPILMLARSRRAAPFALLAAVVQVVLMAITLGFLGRWEALGPGTAAWDAGVAAVNLAVWAYCRTLTERAVLT
ncbi:hypothetical protein [Georgenia alba]|uniref:Uncharacterized protein n=1 Tax=Georgenia alba TaxID=2233858 RepID=A0ABW2Q897_9MICO